MIPPTGADAHGKRGPWRMKMKDQTSRQIMLEIAEGYERLVKRTRKEANEREHLAQTQTERRRCSTVVGVAV